MSEPASRPPVADWTTDFDPHDPRFVADPYPIWAELRERCPVAHSDRYGGLEVLSRWEEVSAAAHDTAAFSSRRVAMSEVPTDREGLRMPPINFDPPDHTTLRRVMLPFFNPRNTAAWEGPIRAICARLLDELEGRTYGDAAEDYAKSLPGEVTAVMLGVPVSEGDRFRQWIHDLLEVGPTNPDVERATSKEMLAYMHRLLAERRAEPGRGDFATYLLGQTLDGEPLPDETMARMLVLLLIAGIDTTWSSIGSAMLHLATHPEDRRRLVEDPSLIPTATEELLRAYAPVYVARVATTDTAVDGCPVTKGDWVLLSFPSANRDPEAFEHPDDVVIDRQVNRHAAFGLGVHRCLGSNLARLEMNIAIEMWLERFPEFSLTDPDAVTFAAGQVRGPRTVPVRLG